ncbi:hypothetical protein E4T56_gene10559 [Termitomyces sp. T112]|nr:hypothetical protein E4T56_gene10559 [Termitomyces sp. T112]
MTVLAYINFCLVLILSSVILPESINSHETLGSVTTRSLDPRTLPNKPPSPQNLPQRSVELPQHSAPTPANSDAFSANSDGPLANSDVFPAAAGTSPGSPEPLGPLPCHA